MKFEVPENCGSCLSIEQFGNKYICGMPVSKEMLDISAFEVDINSRPHWCPKNKVINIINNLSEENKVLVDRMCDGFSAMFELMNNQDDLISRRAAIKIIKNYCENGCDIAEYKWCPSCQREQFIKLLEALPSAHPDDSSDAEK